VRLAAGLPHFPTTHVGGPVQWPGIVFAGLARILESAAKFASGMNRSAAQRRKTQWEFLYR
jgi:hypothetical protein